MKSEERTYLRLTGRISFFAAISYAVDYSFQLVDMFWVAQLGPVAPTAITLVSVILFAVLALNEVIGVSTVSLLAQAFGLGDDAKTGALILNCLLVKLILGLGLVALFFALLVGTTWWQGVDGPLRQMVFDYAWIIWPSLILVPVYSTIMTVLRTVGLEVFAAAVSILVLGVNAAVTPALVFGFAGFEGLGITGAAWATIFAQCVALGLSVSALIRFRPGLRIFQLSSITWQPRLYRKLILIGLPIGVMMIVYSMENVILANLLLDYPIAVSDGFGIGARIFGLIFIINLGITVGVGIGSGRMIGAGAEDAVRLGVQKLSLVVFVFALVLAVSSGLWLGPLLHLFTSDPQTVESAVTYLRYMLFANSFIIVIYALSGVFEGAGLTWPILVSGLISYLVIEFPLLFLFNAHFPGQLEFLWLSIGVAASVGMVITIALFRKGLWQSGPADTSEASTLAGAVPEQR